jgi:hypothetical protein
MFPLQLQVEKFIALPLLALATLLAGCSTVQKISDLSGTTGDWYCVTTSQTPFFRYGPQQGNGPDEQLPHDSIMKVIRPSFGYVKVRLQSGTDGYVASEDIRPAPAALVAEKTAPPPPEPTPSTLVASHEEQFGLDSADPRLIAPPEPLPSLDSDPLPAEASPTPEFR